MKNLIFCCLLVFSFSSFAHFELGPYEGQNKDGQKCEINFLKKDYRFDIHNPLNEIVLVELASGEQFELKHSLVFDREAGNIGFDHDYLTGSKGSRTGAAIVDVKMVHTETKEGPDSFTYIIQDWRTGDKEVMECFDLKHIE